MGGQASDRVTQLCTLFSGHGLPCEASSEIRSHGESRHSVTMIMIILRKQIWCKLLYNLAVSPMSTLTDLSLRSGLTSVIICSL